MPISILPPQVAARIAAGEVITSPAAAVKELIENALDAGASTIDIVLAEGGQTLIRVTDDGCGIPAAEVPLAVARHATSKLRTPEELDHITTLGFRGEALFALTQVAEVILTTRPPEQTAAVRLRCVPGRPPERETVAAPPGTTVVVRHLFAPLPARRAALPPPAQTTAQVARLVEAYALLHPHVRFRLEVDGTLRLQTPGAGGIRGAAQAVWPDDAPRLLEVLAETAVGAVVGLISPPGDGRPTPARQVIGINGRPVRVPALLAALRAATRGAYPADRHPVVALHLRLDPADVDPNVHPAKTEVGLRRETETVALVGTAVRQALRRTPLPAAPRSAFLLPVDAPHPPEGSPPEPPPGVAPPPTLFPDPAGASRPVTRSSAEPAAPETEPALPPLRLLGEYRRWLILAEGPDALYLLDRHVVHERVLYEEILTALPGTAPRQPLLQPLSLEIPPAWEAALEEATPALADLDLEVEPFGPGLLLVRATPVLPFPLAPETLARTALELLAERGETGDLRHRLAARLACRLAVKAGEPLVGRDLQELLERFRAAAPLPVCPHGRFVVRRLPDAWLERAFGRG